MRGILRLAVAVLLVAAACTGSSGNPDSSPGQPSPSTTIERPAAPGGPNILVILTDDQRPGTMSVMPRTRALFRDQGTEFVNAYVTTPLCCPSRASIFTGRYTHNHGVEGNLDAAVLDQRFTIQRYLHDAGYLTGYTGKFLNSWDLSRDPDHLDRWAIFNRGYFDEPFNIDGEVRTVARYSTDFISDQAVEFLEAFETDDERPWFLFVAPYAPHEPWFPEPRYADALVPPWFPSPAVGETDLADKPPAVRDSTYTREGLSTFEDVVEMRGEQLRTLMSVDDMVARLFGVLDELGESDTLAFFLSDNGFLWGEHGLAGVGDDTGKRYPYTPAVEVPFFVRWPGRVEPGAVDERLAANIDLLPTILQAAGLPLQRDPPLDGRSLLGPAGRDEALIEYFRDVSFETVPSWASIRTLEFQYVEWYTDDLSTVTFREYYDLRADPFQLVNVLADGDPANDPDVDQLSDWLERERQCAGQTGQLPCP